MPQKQQAQLMQASRQRHDQTRHHSGFSLVELLIVMAVLAAVAALTLPAMRGPLDKSRLTGAAKQLQAALSKARALAIREGTAVEFRYEISGDRYVIERALTPVDSTITVMEDTVGLSSTPSGLSVESAAPSGLTSQQPVDEGLVAILREGTLPTGVKFSVPETSEFPVDLNLTPTAAVAVPTQLTADVSTVVTRRWSDPLRFQPSGRTIDHVIRITGQRDFFVDVTLRGLTASASYSVPTRTASTGTAPDNSAAPIPGLATPEPTGGRP